jgi:hypothetical protein
LIRTKVELGEEKEKAMLRSNSLATDKRSEQAM